MKRTLMLMFPILMVALSVGFLVYNSLTTTREEAVVSEPAVEETTVPGDTRVPHDIFYTVPVESVAFSHQTHAVENGFQCSTCHTNIFQMKAGSVQGQPDFNMAGFAEGKYCGTCHSTKTDTAFSSGTQCARCHRGVKELERVADTDTSTSTDKA